jgi:hypothetical protein
MASNQAVNKAEPSNSVALTGRPANFKQQASKNSADTRVTINKKIADQPKQTKPNTVAGAMANMTLPMMELTLVFVPICAPLRNLVVALA